MRFEGLQHQTDFGAKAALAPVELLAAGEEDSASFELNATWGL